MRLDVSLQQRQQLSLKLAPQMIQAIEILQLPNIDLRDRIELELAENEVLEVEEEGSSPPEAVTTSADAAAETAKAEDAEEGAGAEDSGGGTDAELAETLDRIASMVDEDREAGMFRSRGEGQEASDRKMEALQATAAPPPTLQDLLAGQLAMLEAPEAAMTVARGIVYCLDADGLFPIHPLARPVLAAADAEGNPTRPLHEVVDAAVPVRGNGKEDETAGRDEAPAPAPGGERPYGAAGWGGFGGPRASGPRDPERAAAQREARRRDREQAREERLREAARVAATVGSLRRRLRKEGVEADLDEEVLLFPLVEVLDLLEGEGVAATLDDATRALDLVQSLEPRGIGGRTPEETLLLQIRPGDPRREAKRTLITHHLEDWKKNRLPRIAQAMGMSLDDLRELLEDMAALHPHPGALLRSERSQVLHPDVVIEWTESDRGEPDYEVRLVNEYFPTLRISAQYLRMFEDAATDPAVKEMLKKKIGSARWLIDAIRQRQETLLRVVREIVRHQRDYLDHGLTRMRPLKMQRIADDLGIHVSTVSRAIADKYAQTPQGILPLKFFFHGGTGSTDGSVESRLSVKDRVRAAIEAEDRKSPLSDEDLAARFKAEGLNIARRTVTKYRKQLGLPSSRERREWA